MKIANRRTFLIYIGIIVGIVVLTNLVSRQMFFRLDLTENGMYTLSSSSRNIIGNLDDRMVAKVYFSDNLPGEYANNRRYLQDMLEEFQAYSKGHLHFEFFRPEDDAELEQEAQKYGIPPIQLQAIENDRMEIKNVWMGLALLYEDRRESLPMIQSTAGLEYQLASAIKKLLNTNKKTVAIAADPAWDGKNTSVTNLLSQTYNLRNINLGEPIPAEVDLLMINSTTDSLDLGTLYNLDQYIMSGRPLFIAQARLIPQLQQGVGRQLNSNLFDALTNYGVTIEPNLLADRVSGQIGVETQRGIFRMRNSVDYPFFPLIQRFNEDNIIVSGLEQVRMFFASEITSTAAAATDANRLFIPLMTTSDNTSVTPGPSFNLAYQNNPAFLTLASYGRTVAGLLIGDMSSYFAVNPTDTGGAHINATASGQILVVSDGAFLSDEAGGSVPENLNFVINATDYLVGDQDLIEVRSREVTARPLKVLSDGTRKTLKWVNILGPSTLLILFGFWRWSKVKGRSKLLEEAYGN